MAFLVKLCSICIVEQAVYLIAIAIKLTFTGRWIYTKGQRMETSLRKIKEMVYIGPCPGNESKF